MQQESSVIRIALSKTLEQFVLALQLHEVSCTNQKINILFSSVYSSRDHKTVGKLDKVGIIER